MTDLSDELATTSKEVITDFGESAVFTRKTKGNYTTTSLEHISSTENTFTVKVFPYDYKQFEIDSVTVLQGDKKAVVATTDDSGTSFTPKVGDILTLEGKDFRVKDVVTHTVNSEPVVYEIQIGI